jgi:signal transduction histidine kinase
MRPLASLRSRIFLASTLASVLPAGLALRFVANRVSAETDEELRRGLGDAARIVEEVSAARAETLTLAARLVADLPKLKAAVATGDPPTVEPVAREYATQIGAQALAVTDARGRVLFSLGPSAGGWPPDAAVAEALRGQRARAFLGTDGAVLEAAAVPILVGPAPWEVAGTLSVGFALDEAEANRLKALSRTDVAFTLRGRVLASSLEGADATDVARASAAGEPTAIDVAGDEHLALARSLGSGAGGPATAVVLRSRSERRRLLPTIRTALAGATIAALALAVALAFGVARSVTRPLSALTAAMRDVAETGDLTRRMPPPRPWDDEDARVLARAFNRLTEAVARFQREAAARERLSALGRLSTVIAHEVRNPLMAIKGALRTLGRQEGLSTDLREATDDIRLEVSRIDGIVGDVLDYARPVRLEAGPTDLNALVREAAETALPAGVALALDPRVGEAMVDAERLRGVLLNLLGNARDAVADRSSGGDPAVTVRTTLLVGGGFAIEVEDRGPGIEPEVATQIFEPYFTTKRKGTGLGLAIAKNVVDAMGGRIAARPREGGGTVMAIELPRGGESQGG